MPAAKVLVVDDELSVLRLVSKVLSARGFEVEAASHPFQALQLVHDMPCFDLVVSDVIMPDMCGPELVRAIIKMCPDAAVVLMSAYISNEALPGNATFIGKPFGLADLCSVAEKALERRGPQEVRRAPAI